MEWWRIAIAVVLALAIAWLLHAANVIGRNPYLRVKTHEDLAGAKFSPDLSLEEKQDRLDWFGGISRRNAKHTAIYIAIVALAGCLVLLVMGR